jgi:hypothetical protein
MFVLDDQAYLLLKSRQIKTKAACSRNYALKDALVIVLHLEQTAFPFQKLPFFPSHMVLNPHSTKCSAVARGMSNKGMIRNW